MNCLLGSFSLIWTTMSTKLWGFSCFLTRNTFGLLVVYFTSLAPHVHFSCLGLYFVSSSLACHVYFMLCSIFFRCFVFWLSFIFSFILYPSCIIILVHIFFSFPHFSWSLCLFVSKRGRVYWKVLSFLYDSWSHSQGEKLYFLCTFVGRESLRGDAYTMGEDIFL